MRPWAPYPDLDLAWKRLKRLGVVYTWRMLCLQKKTSDKKSGMNDSLGFITLENNVSWMPWRTPGIPGMNFLWFRLEEGLWHNKNVESFQVVKLFNHWLLWFNANWLNMVEFPTIPTLVVLQVRGSLNAYDNNDNILMSTHSWGLISLGLLPAR